MRARKNRKTPTPQAHHLSKGQSALALLQSFVDTHKRIIEHDDPFPGSDAVDALVEHYRDAKTILRRTR